MAGIRDSDSVSICIPDPNNDNLGTDGELLKSLHEMQKPCAKITSPAAFVHSLPKTVQRRIKALKQLQCRALHVESQFYTELHQLEAAYDKLYQPYIGKRFDIVSSAVEPTDEECVWASDDDDNDDLANGFEGKASIVGDKKPADDVKGIPGFWLQILRNVNILSSIIQEHDEPALKHLIDIRARTLVGENVGFGLEFVFEANEFFTDEVLTKDYHYKFAVDERKPFDYDGPTVVKSIGCSIDWKPGMNLTLKKVKKLQQHRTSGTKRTVVASQPTDSFFNFFNPPLVPEGEELDSDLEDAVTSDIEIGHFLRDQVVPKAVLYFTGEALDYSDDDDESESSDDESGADEDEASWLGSARLANLSSRSIDEKDTSQKYDGRGTRGLLQLS